MDVAGLAAQLRGGQVPHAVATVVRARRPSSGKPGDRAIVTTDRRLEGWVGGACIDAVVVEEGLAALAAGRPRYVVVDADADAPVPVGAADDDRVTHPLHCESGGGVEVFIEPFTPQLTVAIVGDSPVARTLGSLCEAAGFRVTAAADPAALSVPERGFVAVATMGKADETAARAALLAGAPYVAVVASRRRAAALRRWLVDHGVAEEALAALHAPAGLDLGARTAEGIAVGILAEIVAERARLGAGIPVGEQPAEDTGQPQGDITDAEHTGDPPGAFIDPVCGMTVPASGGLTAEHDGRIFRFCSDHCRRAFLADPSGSVQAAG